MAVISKGITLSYKEGDTTTWSVIYNLQEIPELGGETEALEITTLADEAHMYTEGLKNYGDSLAFKFLYTKDGFTACKGLDGKDKLSWKVALPTGEECTFGGTCSTKLDGVGVNAVMTYTLNIKPTSAMEWTLA